MSILSQPHFHNEVAARERLEQIVWPQGPHCPKCGGFDRITPVKGARPGTRRCGPCKREFTVTVGTVFERSKVPLHKWFQAAHLLGSSKKGLSAHQLHRTLQVTYKTAWFMEHRLREAMRELHPTKPLGGDGKTVEMDETFVGGLEKNKHRSKRKHQGTGGTGKEAVYSLVERGGIVRSHHVPSVNAKTCDRSLRRRLTARRSSIPMKARPLRGLAVFLTNTSPSITASASTCVATFTRIRLKATSPFSSAAFMESITMLASSI